MRWPSAGRLVVAVSLVACACASADSKNRYRFTDSGEYWTSPSGREIEDLLARYPDYFDVILDPGNTSDPDLRPLRDDLEHRPVDDRNYDALNALAIGYFELNYRAGLRGPTYFADNFRAAKLLAVPWRAYEFTEDGALRDAILDFFEDAGTGEKIGAAATAPRLHRIVASLASKESDPARLARIHRLMERITPEPVE